MVVPNFIVKSIGHLEKNYFFSCKFSSFFSVLISALEASFLASSFGNSSFLDSSVAKISFFESATVSLVAGAKFSSVTVSGFTSTSIPIFFLIFSAILAHRVNHPFQHVPHGHL